VDIRKEILYPQFQGVTELGGKLLLRVLRIAEVLRRRGRLALPLVVGMMRRTSAFLALAHGGV
jgi:hypothetical protein